MNNSVPFYKLNIDGLEGRLKDGQTEITALKNEMEKANKRVQDLTVKIIESGTRSSGRLEEVKSPVDLSRGRVVE